MDGRRIVYVGGIPASGKTTISYLTAERTGVEYISSGEIKRGEAWKTFGKNLSSLGQEDSFKINSWFFQKLFAEKDNGIYLVDTHYTYPVGGVFVKLLPEECAGGIDLFILFEADAETVMARRVARGRDRDSIDKCFIEKEIEKEREEAVRISGEVSVPLKIIKNVGAVQEGVNCLEGFLKV